jgi:hypothetical protein
MKRNLILLLIVIVAVSTLAIGQSTQMGTATNITKAAVAASATSGDDGSFKSKADYKFVGNICDLSKVIKGGEGKLSKEKAAKLLSRAQPLVLKTEKGKVYFVFNADGSYAGKKLAAYAGSSLVGINGKLKKVNGMNIIIADKMDKVK